MSEKIIKRARRMAKLVSGDAWEHHYKKFKRDISHFRGGDISDSINKYRQAARAEEMRQAEIRSLILKSRGHQ